MILALLAAAALASAEAPAEPQVEPAAQTEELKPNQRRMKVVCRNEVPTGTRFAKRVCTPVEELRAREEAARETMMEASRQYQTATGN